MGFLRRLVGRSETAAERAWPPPGPIIIWPPSNANWEGSIPAELVNPGRKLVDVVGEASYQGSLEAIAGGRTIDGPRIRDHTALLVPEPTNPYDPNAVRVVVVTGAGIGGVIGYLSRDDAVAYRPMIDRLAGEGLVLACRASLSGGWDRGAGDRGNFGVRLAMGTPDELLQELERR